MLLGFVKIILTRIKLEKGNKILAELSIVISILMVLFLAVTKEVYAVVVAFLLLMIKGIILIRKVKMCG